MIAASALSAFGLPGGIAGTTVIEEPDPEPRVVLPDESGQARSPQDGGGTVTVEPKTVTARQPTTLTFTYTAGEKGVGPGGGVVCHVTHFWHWTPPQDEWPDRPGYCTVTCTDARVELDVHVDPQDQTILARIVSQPLVEGTRLTIVYGDTSGGKHPDGQARADRYSERDERFFFKVDGDGDGWFVPVAQQPCFEVAAGPAVRLMAMAPSRVPVSEPVALRVSALDAVDNLAAGFTGEVAISFDESVVDGPRVARFTAADQGSIGIAFSGKRPGLARFSVEDGSGRLSPALTNTVVIHEAGEQRYRLFWADLQIHGNHSDGTGTPSDIYRYARDVAGLDAAALTEHDHWGYLPLEEHEDQWGEVLAAAAEFQEDGRFVTFPAFEWTNWTYGHQHVLFARPEDAVIRPWKDARFDHPTKLWRSLRGIDCVTIPHHCGGEPIPTCWKYHDPVLQPVVEMVSIHGVSERMDQPGCVRGPQKSGMAQSALARGYRLGFIGGGDTHDGHPGVGSPGSPRPGLAGIYAERLTRESILEAIRARRVYATNGCRAILRFHSGDVAMGGVIRLRDATAPRKLEVIVVGDAPIASMTIVKNNEEVAIFEESDVIAARTWHDESRASSGDYYYARIAQSDGGWIWSSPIWVEAE